MTVIRVAGGSFDPARFAEVDAVTNKVGVTFTPIVNHPMNWTI